MIKKIVMILCTLMVAACLFLPCVTIQGKDFSGVDILLNSHIEFESKIMAVKELITFSTPNIFLIIAVLAILLALNFVFVPIKDEKKMRIVNGVLVFAIVSGNMATFALARVSPHDVDMSMGIGIYLISALEVVFFIYACTPYKMPVFEVNVYILLFFAGVLFVYPYLNTFALSLDKSGEIIGVVPKQWTLDNFKYVLMNPKIISGFKITISRTIIGTAASLFCTTIFSYGLSKRELIGRNIYLKICIFTMYFSGGIIPGYLLISKLGLTNNFMVFIIPNLLNVYNMILMVNYFKGLPSALEESAKIDGAKELKILFSIFIPLSMPIIAIILLFSAVFQWNSWYDGYMFIMGRPDLKPLQNVLTDIINESQIAKFLSVLPSSVRDKMEMPIGKSIVSAAIIVTIGPIILVYPYLQRHFIKGIMLGSLKG